MTSHSKVWIVCCLVCPSALCPSALDTCSYLAYFCSRLGNNAASLTDGPGNGALRQHPPSGSRLVARSRRPGVLPSADCTSDRRCSGRRTARTGAADQCRVAASNRARTSGLFPGQPRCANLPRTARVVCEDCGTPRHLARRACAARRRDPGRVCVRIGGAKRTPRDKRYRPPRGWGRAVPGGCARDRDRPGTAWEGHQSDGLSAARVSGQARGPSPLFEYRSPRAAAVRCWGR